ncbi:ABC transporter substrate-binding protein [Nocardioidaceae bacterium SCSIO 66511]|nr:ABC transporter substrate-binding protein [Nocardioidaceae bacterium SCSIO 66511]
MKKILALASAGVLALSLAACGGDDDSGGAAGGTGEPWTLGTTDKVTALDPAGAYDLGSSTLHYAIYQTLLTIPAGENKPQGDAAEKCEYKDPKTVVCTLRDGLKFSNGDELTSSDVKYSFDRNLKIADPNGASTLLASLKDIETPDDKTVQFNLSRPDTTFQFVLTHSSTSIVDEDVFPADKIAGDADVIGSGPYVMDDYESGQQASLKKSETYQGANEGKSPLIFVKYYPESSNLKLAIQNDEVQVAWRSLSPTDLTDLEGNDSVNVEKGEGAEIRYWTWQLGTPVGKDKAIRQAVAQLVDRQAISDRAYEGTVDPLYSPVPPGFPGQVDSFKTKYGEPSVDKAKAILQKAGVKTPVDITLGYTPSHYGPNAVDEATELKSQLNDSGLFNATTKSAEWEQYQNLYKENAYDLFILGWFPDFLDADNYLSPFFVDGGFYANNYKNPEINKLVAEEQGTDDAATREKAFGKIQDIAAEDVPTVPTWVGKNVAVTQPGIDGVKETLDPAFIFRFWMVSYQG